jgi:hypothetical protein
MLGIAVSLIVSRCLNRSLYDYAIRMKQLPVLRNNMPSKTRLMRVRDIISNRLSMDYELEVLESVCTVERLYEVT